MCWYCMEALSCYFLSNFDNVVRLWSHSTWKENKSAPACYTRLCPFTLKLNLCGRNVGWWILVLPLQWWWLTPTVVSCQLCLNDSWSRESVFPLRSHIVCTKWITLLCLHQVEYIAEHVHRQTLRLRLKWNDDLFIHNIHQLATTDDMCWFLELNTATFSRPNSYRGWCPFK